MRGHLHLWRQAVHTALASRNGSDRTHLAHMQGPPPDDAEPPPLPPDEPFEEPPPLPPDDAPPPLPA